MIEYSINLIDFIGIVPFILLDHIKILHEGDTRYNKGLVLTCNDMLRSVFTALKRKGK